MLLALAVGVHLFQQMRFHGEARWMAIERSSIKQRLRLVSKQYT